MSENKVSKEVVNEELMSQERHVIDRLTTIRVGKSKILATLDMLKKKKDDGETVDSQLMSRLVESYDNLKAQEDDYLGVMKQIIEARTTKTEIEAMKLQNENNAALEDGDSSDVDWEDVKKELEELKKIANDAEAASAINDQLVNRLQLHRQKKNVLNALREKKSGEQVKEANDALQQVEMAKLQLASEQDTVDRKQRQLERLRREAVKRGILPDPNPKPRAEPVEPKPNPIKEKLQAKVTQERLNDSEKPVPDELVPADRVPPVPLEDIALPKPKGPEEETSSSKKNQRKKSKKELLEEARQNREDVSAKIRERLAALEERKERMREIHLKLARAEEQKMEDTYAAALKRLQNLTAMRQHLEEIKESGQSLTPDQEQELEKLGVVVSQETENEPEKIDGAEQLREETENLQQSSDNQPSLRAKMVQLLDANLVSKEVDDDKESSISKENDSKEHSLSPEFYGADSKKAEAAKRQLSSGRAKLEKQRTLERVRCFTTATEESKVAAEKIPESNGMEKEICMIVEVVLPWMKGHETEVVQEELIKELRDLVLDQSTKVCFPAGHVSDLFKSQLTTILDDTLAQYIGSKLEDEREQLIFDLSEILYNELAFFKLMHNIEAE
uniref:Pericentriolar material 1 protein C-terminal domain-containing protein n=1 Tax=Acrobeloides nanus TaxID=290746 RepID=A0A914CFY0_9BILA